MSQPTSVVSTAAIPPPPPFLDVPGKPIRAWPVWKRTFLSFLRATGLDAVEPSRKKEILFSMLGFEGQRIATTFQLEEARGTETLNEFEAFVGALEKHFDFSGSSAL